MSTRFTVSIAAGLLGAAILIAHPSARTYDARQPLARTVISDEPATSLYVTVESNGRPVSGLTAADFQLLQDGEPVPFRVAPVERPARVMVLVENTVRARRLFESEITMALGALSAIAGDGHEYAVASFGTRVSTAFDFSRNVGRLGHAYQRDIPEPAAGEPALFDAIATSLDRLDALPGRRVLIVVATGDDASREVTRRALRERLQESNVVVFFCGVGSDLRWLLDFDRVAIEQVGASVTEFELRSLAVSSGGAAWFPAGHGIADAMANLVERVDGAYRLAYAPALRADGRPHPITVGAWRVSADGIRTRLTVVAKDAWRIPMGDPEE